MLGRGGAQRLAAPRSAEHQGRRCGGPSRRPPLVVLCEPDEVAHRGGASGSPQATRDKLPGARERRSDRSANHLSRRASVGPGSSVQARPRSWRTPLRRLHGGVNGDGSGPKGWGRSASVPGVGGPARAILSICAAPPGVQGAARPAQTQLDRRSPDARDAAGASSVAAGAPPRPRTTPATPPGGHRARWRRHGRPVPDRLRGDLHHPPPGRGQRGRDARRLALSAHIAGCPPRTKSARPIRRRDGEQARLAAPLDPDSRDETSAICGPGPCCSGARREMLVPTAVEWSPGPGR